MNADAWVGAIATGTDDAEQLGSGAIRLANSGLELVVKQGDVQQVGLRFTDVQIPANATIESAYLQFLANGVSTGPVLLNSGSGKRTADSVEGGFAPRLVITYTP